MRYLTGLLILLCCESNAQWLQAPNFIGTARDDASVFHGQEEIYIGCGRDVNFGLMNDWYKVTINDSFPTWSVIPSLPASGRQYCTTFQQFMPSSFSSSSAFLLFGGQDANGALNELWRFSPLALSWSQLPSMPAAPRSAAVGFYISFDDEYHVVGGILDNGAVVSEHWVFDMNDSTWAQLPDFPGTSRHRASASSQIGSYFTYGGWPVASNFGHPTDVVVLAGGADSNFVALSDAWKYTQDPTPTWTQINDLPAPRYGMASAPRGIFAGGASNDSTYHDDIYWTQGSDFSPIQFNLPAKRKGAVIAASHVRINFGLGIDAMNTRYDDWYSNQSSYTSIHNISTDKTLTVYPNPASELLTVPFDCDLMFFNSLGELVLNISAKSSVPTNINFLSEGVYCLRGTDKSGTVRSTTLVLKR